MIPSKIGQHVSVGLGTLCGFHHVYFGIRNWYYYPEGPPYSTPEKILNTVGMVSGKALEICGKVYATSMVINGVCNGTSKVAHGAYNLMTSMFSNNNVSHTHEVVNPLYQTLEQPVQFAENTESTDQTFEPGLNLPQPQSSAQRVMQTETIIYQTETDPSLTITVGKV